MKTALKLIKKLPFKIRDPIIRGMIEYPSQIPDDLEFKVASTKEELEQAFSLLHDAYVKENLMVPHPSGMRVTKYHCLPSTSTLVAIHAGRVVGTLSLVRQSAFGVPCETIFDLTQLPKTARVAEVSSLAIHKDFLHQGGRILFPMLKFLYHYATEYFGVSYFVIAVSPKWFDFYQSVLRFKKLSNKTVKNYQFVNGAEAAGGWLDLEQAQYDYHKLYAKQAPKRDLYRFFKKIEPHNMHFPLRKTGLVTDPVLTPYLFKHFFIDRTEVIKNLSDYDLLILKQIYDHTDYYDLIPSPSILPLSQARRSKRFDVCFNGRLYLQGRPPIRLLVNSISKVGLGGVFKGLISSAGIKAGSYELELNTEEATSVKVRGDLAWISDTGCFGFKIEEVEGQDWSSLIDQLNQRILRVDEITEPQERATNQKRSGLG